VGSSASNSTSREHCRHDSPGSNGSCDAGVIGKYAWTLPVGDIDGDVDAANVQRVINDVPGLPVPST
jgi:hypothetical protein